MSRFSRSRVRSRGPGSLPPRPGARLGCGTCGLVCPMAAEVAARSPPAAPTATMSRREIGFMMLSRLHGLLIARNRQGEGRVAGKLIAHRTPTNTRRPWRPPPLCSYVLITAGWANFPIGTDFFALPVHQTSEELIPRTRAGVPVAASAADEARAEAAIARPRIRFGVMSSPLEIGNCRTPVRRSSEAVYSDRPEPLMAPTIDMRRRRRIRWRH